MRIVTNKEVKYCFIVFLIYGLVFEFALMSIHPMFKYIDELYAILFVPLGIKYFFSLDQIINKKIFLLILLFVLLGVSTNIVYGYQNIQAVMKDIFLNIKFLLLRHSPQQQKHFTLFARICQLLFLKVFIF